MEYAQFTTREFVPDFYEREIMFGINGNDIFPKNYDFNNYTLLNIRVKATNLSNNKAITYKKDPLCCLERQTHHGWKEYARTEVCWYNDNPVWIRPFTLCVKNGQTELLLFEIYDIGSNYALLERQLLLGSCELDLNVLLSSPTNSITLDIIPSKNLESAGNLHVSYHLINSSIYGSFIFRSNLNNFINNSIFHKVLPYFIINVLDPTTEEMVPIYKSAVSKGFHWDNIELSLQMFGEITCNTQENITGNTLKSFNNHIIRVSLYDFVLRSSDKFLGFFDTTFDIFFNHLTSNFNIVNDQGVHICNFNSQVIANIERPRFNDYQLKGIKISSMFAIDFSSSKVSMLKTNKVNHIENGIFTYGNLINELFENLNKICSSCPVTGYAFADFKGEKIIPLRLKNNTAQFSSIKLLMKAYGKIRDTVSYPREAPLAPVIRKARSIATEHWNQSKTITLIIVLTNGLISDLQNVVDELVDAENEPICMIMALLGGTRRELEKAFNPSKNELMNSEGKCTNRLMATLINYQKNCIYADLSLESRLAPAIRRMATEFIEQSDYNPFK
ncbi:hypothetical protein TRFO_32992 [Tritrichomonas foetus]|uniref:C2 domain-containing protein n=1 Tax=Tritrichomonas foetus TaxID=1144522 RepID=A0A1J4JMP7_9EUKA|nr:hypothetical protein TRFO_32992 [Tritrichomonas foetus]|eukprot:OHT00393.1 hypothetical protein TRFO_32992 [Tritrichomonas foetus]